MRQAEEGEEGLEPVIHFLHKIHVIGWKHGRLPLTASSLAHSSPPPGHPRPTVVGWPGGPQAVAAEKSVEPVSVSSR